MAKSDQDPYLHWLGSLDLDPKWNTNSDPDSHYVYLGQPAARQADRRIRTICLPRAASCQAGWPEDSHYVYLGQPAAWQADRRIRTMFT